MTRQERLVEELLEAADKCDKQAKQFEGCTFMGEWPGSHYLRQASLLTEAAYTIRRAIEGEGK